MKHHRLGALGVVVGALLLFPTTSQAWDQEWDCGVLQPGGYRCPSHGPHSLEGSLSWYPGPQAHHVRTCTYIYNMASNVIRGGVIDCEWSDGVGYGQVNFGPTYHARYRAYVYNAEATCCPHTVKGWTYTTN